MDPKLEKVLNDMSSDERKDVYALIYNKHWKDAGHLPPADGFNILAHIEDLKLLVGSIKKEKDFKRIQKWVNEEKNEGILLACLDIKTNESNEKVQE